MTSPPPVAEPFRLPFHYGALHNVGLDFLVDPEPVRAALADRHPALTAAEFDGCALVSLNYQLYFAQYGNGAGITQEIEVNVVAFPTGAGDRVAGLSYADYAGGVDQSKLLGIGRIHVLCDNLIAIDAGTKLYAEPKYPAWFEAAMPSLNGPETETWSITCKRAEFTEDGTGLIHRDDTLFSFAVDLEGLPRRPVNNTPITGYGTDTEGRLLAGPLNVYQPYQQHVLAESDRARLTVHAPDSPVGRDLHALVGDAPAAGVWSYQSAPVGAHNRPYYVPAYVPAQC
jgi:hypothetical protein